jgi:hypothetical protein
MAIRSDDQVSWSRGGNLRVRESQLKRRTEPHHRAAVLAAVERHRSQLRKDRVYYCNLRLCPLFLGLPTVASSAWP